MAKILARKGKRRKWMVLIIVAPAMVLGLLCLDLRRYAYAATWHCLHGDYAEIGGHRVKLPIFWWKQDAHAYDTSLLVRACLANTINKPEIIVSPAIPGETRDTDEEELRATQDDISSRNRGSNPRTSSSLVVLHTRPFTLYCKKENIVVSGIDLDSNLFCHVARGPYLFSYDGSPSREIEAESILSSLE